MNALPILVAAMVSAIAVRTGLVRLRILREAAQARADHDDGLAETMGGLILRCDGRGSVMSVSSNCAALLGVSRGALMGHGFFERVQVADRPAFLKAISDARAGSVTAKATLRWRGSGQVNRADYAEPVFLWLEMRARQGTKRQSSGKEAQTGGVVVILRDVSEAKRCEMELAEARAAAEEAKRGKDYFLAHAGHELRTPLNAIVGFSELLGDPNLAPLDLEKQGEYARIIHQTGRHLLAVVNSLSNMAEIQCGALAIEREPFAVAPLIDLCCDMVKLHAQKRGVELLRAYPENLAEITGDKRACTQILVNLLSNAIKFTPAKGSVTISARPERDWLLIHVADTGIGIAARDLAHLGDPFFQATVPDGREKGTGLGLAIVRGLVGLQGGAIAVASELDKGTCVYVHLPLDCRPLAGPPRGPAKIETIARLPHHDERDLFNQMTVQKIA